MTDGLQTNGFFCIIIQTITDKQNHICFFCFREAILLLAEYPARRFELWITFETKEPVKNAESWILDTVPTGVSHMQMRTTSMRWTHLTQRMHASPVPAMPEAPAVVVGFRWLLSAVCGCWWGRSRSCRCRNFKRSTSSLDCIWGTTTLRKRTIPHRRRRKTST